ncbi:MAG: twin-arginine translocase TatA/TatE family subunit [Candidatus Zixiibacteriota bacterium]|nr:MAG: twin-arginine translocase TatA/TatE family subunit [candidate division Zixibacteria bacterium]
MDQAILISMPGGGELIIILVIVLILFGAKRIPEIASGLGKGIREFKKSIKDVQSEIDIDEKSKGKITHKETDSDPDSSKKQ